MSCVKNNTVKNGITSHIKLISVSILQENCLQGIYKNAGNEDAGTKLMAAHA